MENSFSRTELLLGKDKIELLKNKKVLIFGIGGVGGFVCEALARTGIGYFDLVDNDKVSISNINRQIIATTKTIGLYKCELMKERIISINPSANVKTYNLFYTKDNQDVFDFNNYDYIIDCIDTVTSKLLIIEKATKLNKNIISSMGTGNKINPMMLEISDIFKTSVDPLAKVMRYELRKRGIKKLKVLYSKELPMKLEEEIINENNKVIPGSISFVPSVGGLIIASEVIKDLTGIRNDNKGA